MTTNLGKVNSDFKATVLCLSIQFVAHTSTQTHTHAFISIVYIYIYIYICTQKVHKKKGLTGPLPNYGLELNQVHSLPHIHPMA